MSTERHIGYHERARVDDPLPAIGRQLVAAAARRLNTRRRRIRILLTAVVGVGLLGATGGALAVTDVSTGVPAIDRVLDSGSEVSDGTTPDGPGSEALTYQPLPGSVTSPVNVRYGEGRSAVAVAYQSQDEMLCVALAEADTPAGAPQGTGGCLRATLLAAALSRGPVRLSGGSGLGASDMLVHGFTSGDVDRLALTASSGRITASLSEGWTPPRWDGGPVRAFFAVIEGGAAEFKAQHAFPALMFEARLADGQVLAGDLREAP
jgi:hypothetical protein